MKAITNPNAQYRIPMEVFILMLNEPIPEGVKLGKWAYGFFDSDECELDKLRFTIPGKKENKQKWVEIVLTYDNTIVVLHPETRGYLKHNIRSYRANNVDVEHLQPTDDI